MQLTYLLYADAEPIDLAPIGVFSMGARVIPELTYRVAALSLEPVRMSNGLRVLPDIRFDEASDVDTLLVPGGAGWAQAARNDAILNFIRKCARDATLVSICTGSLILAAAGVLDGLVATTKCRVVPPECSPLDELARHSSITTTRALLVDNGRVITGGGVTLGIDTALYLISKRYGEGAAQKITDIMEYDAARAANARRLQVALGGDALRKAGLYHEISDALPARR